MLSVQKDSVQFFTYKCDGWNVFDCTVPETETAS